MFKINVEPTSKIEIMLGINPGGKVQKKLVDICARHMDKYVPMDTGSLRNNITKTSDSITYEENYAHAQYVGYTKGPVKKYTTPGTGPYWDERMMSAEGNQVVSEIATYIKEKGNI